MDEFIDALLRDEIVFGIALPRLPKRIHLQEAGYIDSKQSVFGDAHVAERHLIELADHGSVAAQQALEERRKRLDARQGNNSSKFRTLHETEEEGQPPSEPGAEKHASLDRSRSRSRSRSWGRRTRRTDDDDQRARSRGYEKGYQKLDADRHHDRPPTNRSWERDGDRSDRGDRYDRERRSHDDRRRSRSWDRDRHRSERIDRGDSYDRERQNHDDGWRSRSWERDRDRSNRQHDFDRNQRGADGGWRADGQERGDRRDYDRAKSATSKPTRNERSKDTKYGSLFKDKSKKSTHTMGSSKEKTSESNPPEEGSEEYWNQQRAKLGMKPLAK